MEDKGGLGSERVWSATDGQDHRFADFQGGFELLIDLVYPDAQASPSPLDAEAQAGPSCGQVRRKGEAVAPQ